VPKKLTQAASYKFICNQGHLSPSYGELLRGGVGGMLDKIRKRRAGETDAARLAFLEAAEQRWPDLASGRDDTRNS
jgi:hypothetical protein